MKLVRDYLGFAVWFAGIGYVVLWPLAEAGDGMPFGGSYVCVAGVLSVLCGFDHPLTLPPALHVLGALLAVVVVGRLARRLLRRLRRPAHIHTATPDPGLPVAVSPPARRLLLRLPRQVRRRSEFGLRRPSP
jgi:hypothetical protein